MSCLGLTGMELQLCRAADAAEQAAAAANALHDDETWIDAVEALADAMATLLLPILALYIAWRLSPLLVRIVERRSFSIKIAGFELSAQEATDQLRKQIEDLQSKVASLATGPPVAAGAATAKSPSGETGARSPSAALGDASASPAAQAPEEASASTAASASRPRRMLWVDDRPENNAVLIAGISEAGIQVETAVSTDDAIRMLEDPKRYALVISDLGRFEGLLRRSEAGVDLINRMKELDIHLPLAIFTGGAGMRKAEQVRAAGADLVTSSPTELRRFIEKHLGPTRAD